MITIKEKLYKSTRVKILTDKEELIELAFDEIKNQRTSMEKYIEENPEFLNALEPIQIKKNAPEVVKKMVLGAKIADVGPMAAVAGVLAEYGCRKLISLGAKIALIENGGDIFVISNTSLNIGLFTGNNKLSDKLALRIKPEQTPLSICSSSSYLGHSLSFGNCDLATVFSAKSEIADAAATQLGNKVRSEEDIEKALNWAAKLKGVKGAIAIKGNKIGIIGDIPELVSSKDKKLKEKITKEPFYKL